MKKDRLSEETCPLCHKQNHCEINSNQPCWCTNEIIPKEIFEQLSKEQIRKSCICKACITNNKV